MGAIEVSITSGYWRNIGGVSSVLLNKEVTELPVRFHGPKNLKRYLEYIRPFLDTDCRPTTFPVSVVELTHESGSYEDDAFRVRYIPLFGPTSSTIDTAFLVEMKVGGACDELWGKRYDVL